MQLFLQLRPSFTPAFFPHFNSHNLLGYVGSFYVCRVLRFFTWWRELIEMSHLFEYVFECRLNKITVNSGLKFRVYSVLSCSRVVTWAPSVQKSRKPVFILLGERLFRQKQGHTVWTCLRNKITVVSLILNQSKSRKYYAWLLWITCYLVCNYWYLIIIYFENSKAWLH